MTCFSYIHLIDDRIYTVEINGRFEESVICFSPIVIIGSDRKPRYARLAFDAQLIIEIRWPILCERNERSRKRDK